MKLKMDTSSLIYAVKIGIMDLIFKLFDDVIISHGVAIEATKKRGKPDADYIWKLIKNRKIKAIEADPIDSESLGLGERTIISLALRENPEDYLLILDDRRARVLAGIIGIDSVPLYSILFIALNKKIIDLTNAKRILIDLEKIAGYPKERIIEISKTLELIYGEKHESNNN